MLHFTMVTACHMYAPYMPCTWHTHVMQMACTWRTHMADIRIGTHWRLHVLLAQARDTADSNRHRKLAVRYKPEGTAAETPLSLRKSSGLPRATMSCLYTTVRTYVIIAALSLSLFCANQTTTIPWRLRGPQCTRYVTALIADMQCSCNASAWASTCILCRTATADLLHRGLRPTCSESRLSKNRA